jgi:hypothetical protein
VNPFIKFLIALFTKKLNDAVPHGSSCVEVQSEITHATLPVNQALTNGVTFSPSFNIAFAKAMKWETGLMINFSDPEIQAGLINTQAQRKKVGYTDGVSGASVHDSGGETKFGVAQKAHPNIVVRSLTLAQAEEIYKRGYWDAVSGDKLNPDVARYVFDIGCGSGPRKGALLLQRALGVNEDGVIGQQTIASANATDSKELVAKLQKLRIDFYRSIVANDPSQSVFLNGWLNRANDI